MAATRPASLLSLGDEIGALAGPWRVRARVVREPAPASAGSYFLADVREVRVGGRWRSLTGRVEIDMPEPQPHPPWLPGTTFEAFLPLRLDRPPANPGGRPHDRLASRGVDARARLKSYRQARRDPASQSGPATWGARLRIGVRGAIAARFPARRGLVAALILGERRDLEESAVQQLARSGLIHLLAISGLHVGLIVACPAIAVATLGGSPRHRLVAALLTTAALPLVVVARAPVRRAATMAATMLAARLAGRSGVGLESLAAAVLLVVAMDPRAAADRGLHLSVAATAAVMSFGSESRRRRGAALLRSAAAAWTATAPLVALETHAVAPMAVLLNPIAIPLVALTLPLVLVAIGATVVGAPTLAAGLTEPARMGLAALETLARRGAELGPGLVAVPTIGIAIVLSTWLGLAALRGGGRATLLGGAILALSAVAALRPPPPPAEPELVAFDVGQGDALLLHARSGAWLVDGGGYPGVDYDVGARILAPQLRRRGVRELRAVALTHPHGDHAGGLASVLDEFAVHELWLGSTPPDDAIVVGLLRRARRSRVAALGPAGAERRMGACTWRALLPAARWLRAGARTVENEASLVLAVRCGHRRLLLAGDAGLPVEHDWPVETLVGAVLKVGHHGSAGSTGEALIEGLRPRHALISVGARNPWALPRAVVLARLRGAGAAVYRTDRDGAVTLRLGTRVRARGERWRWGDPRGSWRR